MTSRPVLVIERGSSSFHRRMIIQGVSHVDTSRSKPTLGEIEEYGASEAWLRRMWGPRLVQPPHRSGDLRGIFVAKATESSQAFKDAVIVRLPRRHQAA